MKKIVLAIAVVCLLSSCATIFGGPVSDCQRRKPLPGEPERQVRVGALVADIIIFWPAVIVDFGTHAIYRPCPAPMPKAEK